MLATPAENIRAMPAAIATAETGIAAVDKSIKEFYETGYLHNHVRMYVASITCNIGKAHWSAPAKWMYYHLLDGDLASNTCSWQWVAGAFSSKKYYCNQENINRYTHSLQQNTFLDAPTEILFQAPIPEALKATTNLNLTTRLPSLPKPVIDTTKPTLIYNYYNLDPMWRKDDDANRVLLLEHTHFQKYPVSDKVIEFIIALSRNIANVRIWVGEIGELESLYKTSLLGTIGIISKEHPAFIYYPGQKDAREWMYPEVTGYFGSFFSYWKKCEKQHQ
ncbi:MAG: FAD-binding domain-containing protein [Cytophagales bacterium]